MKRLFAFSPTEALPVDSSQAILAVGGAKSSGLKIAGLRHGDDYAVVSETADGFFAHCLRGKRPGKLKLEPGRVYGVDDLFLCVLDSASAAGEDRRPDWSELLLHFSADGDLEPALTWFLKQLLRQTEMEKGVLITREPDGSYRAPIKEGVKSGDTWLSEALVQEILTNGKPQWIHNRLGSHLEGSRSLMATGFLSVFALPLVARGEILGAVLVGSSRPHSGLTASQKEELTLYVQLGSLLFWFHRRDQESKREIERLKRARGTGDCPLLTASPRVEQEIEIARRLASTNLSVLIQGETGVGKEVMARWIHEQSERRKGAFVALNCAAIPSELLESILFGHRKGAFTGANADQAGKFQLAHGGTILLDEIGDLPERLQAKLLRVLQEGTIDPIGSPRPVKVDVRVIAATHRDLSSLVKRGIFRQDLFFRIAETVVTIPPLRERPEDIALLATRFLADFAPGKTFRPETLHWLGGLQWSGNVRELQSAVRRASALSQGNELRQSDFLLGLPEAKVESSDHWLGGPNLEEAKERFVQEKVRLALERSGGNRQRAAELLGVTPRTLFRYLEIQREEDLVTTHDINVSHKEGGLGSSLEIPRT